jgi:hypothetical protein
MSHLNAVRVSVPLVAFLLAMPIPSSAQGWYMLTPPVERGTFVVNEATPLPQWRPSRLYESARECEEIRANWVAAVKRFEGSLRRARALGTRCIAATDPRLTSATPSATAQTGSYLLMPPRRRDPGPPPSEPGGVLPSTPRVDRPAPLVHWNHDGSFDTEAECEAARQGRRSGPGTGQDDRLGAQCIAVDDRRLAADATP